MSKVSIKDSSVKDFIRPEDERPEKGPIYAINTTSRKIVFSQNDRIPGVVFGATPTPESIRQISVDMLDTVSFMRYWATGDIAVSTSPKVAKEFTKMEIERHESEKEKKNEVIESIYSRDSSHDYDVQVNETGLPEVKKTEPSKRRNTKQDEKNEDSK